MMRYLPRFAFLTGTGVLLFVMACSPAFGADDKGGSSGGIFSSLFGSFFVKKERSFLEIRGGISLLREENSYPDPMLGLELNAAFSRYLNIEVGAGGYHEQVPHWVWNGFLSYIVAGFAYTMTSLAGGHDKFHDLRDPILIKINDLDNPYHSTSLSAGGFIVPFPSLRFQPQVGLQLMKTQVRNKGSALRSVDAFKTMASFGIERRGEAVFSGLRVLVNVKGERSVEGIKAYYGLDL